jgi:hypothetical protein
MKAFLRSLQTTSDDFRTEFLRKNCELQKSETDYQEIKRRTEPLIRRLNMPERDSSKREARLKNPILPHKIIVRERPRTAEPSKPMPTPVEVLPFQTEKFNAFGANNQLLAISSRGPIRRRRYATKT